MFLTGYFCENLGLMFPHVSLKSKAETFSRSHDSLNIKYCDVQNEGMRSKQKRLDVTNTEMNIDQVGNEWYIHVWVHSWQW